MMTGIKQKLLLIGVPVLLVGGGLSSIAASAATSPTATPSLQTQPAEKAETADAAEAVTPAEAAAEAQEAALPGGGHADNPNDASADNQFEGVQ